MKLDELKRTEAKVASRAGLTFLQIAAGAQHCSVLDKVVEAVGTT